MQHSVGNLDHIGEIEAPCAVHPVEMKSHMGCSFLRRDTIGQTLQRTQELASDRLSDIRIAVSQTIPT